jgi:hypothetical protein
MDKKLTAIQTLIQDMEALKKTKLYENSFKAINDCIALAYAQLDEEKENLEDAFTYAWTMKNQTDNDLFTESNHYFKETYKN